MKCYSWMCYSYVIFKTISWWKVVAQQWTTDIKNFTKWMLMFSKHRPSGPMLSISRNIRLSVCLSACLSVCVFTFEVPFNGLFAPSSQTWMSNIFRDSESFGKSNGKKWSNIWTFLFGNGLKSPRKKSFFFADLAGYNRLIPLICSGYSRLIPF